MADFKYDANLIREIAEEKVRHLLSTPTGDSWGRLLSAGIQWYCDVYKSDFMGEIAETWDDCRGDAPAWGELTNEQMHRVLAEVADGHFRADIDYFEDSWHERVAMSVEDAAAYNNPVSTEG